MRRRNEEFVEDHPAFAEHKSLSDFLSNGYVDPHSSRADSRGHEDFVAHHGASTLSKFYISSATVPMNSDRSRKIPEDVCDFCQCINHLDALDLQLKIEGSITPDDSVFREDQILRAVHTMGAEKKFPTWAVFAMQIFIDTRRELGAHLSRGLEDLREAWAWLGPAWTECLDVDKTHNFRNVQDACYRPVEEQIARMSQVVDGDIVQAMMDNQVGREPEETLTSREKNCFLLRNHPLLCGIWLQDGLGFMHLHGTNMAAGYGSIATVIHLNQAVSLAGIHLDGNVWNTKSNQALRINRKRGRVIFPLSRYISSTCKINGPESKWYTIRAASAPFVLMEALVNRFNNSKDISRPADPLNEMLSEKQPSLTPLRSLEIFKLALKEDDLSLRFDLMSLNWRCLMLLRSIQNVCMYLSPHEYSPFKADDGHFVGLIAHMLACVLGSKHEEPTRFQETCDMVHDIVAREGNVEYLAAQARVGIVKGAARVGEEDFEDFEDLDENSIHC
ncbi:hypothetical protein DE146DRAFT_735824 [Phaeosphaeria sp. MPI-PUGE-AT-0046c]|nr:hypothetical protein DE146DRAFT_735824 [Phaeosphaeria sp. MPI-PUGE-AT-0046c]